MTGHSVRAVPCARSGSAPSGGSALHLEETMGEHLYTYIDPPNARHLEQIVDTLRRDGVIAIPTGTGWAFCVNPASKKARTRMVRSSPPTSPTPPSR